MKLTRIGLVATMVLGGLLACGTVANAQDAGKDAKKGKGPTVEQRLERLSKELNLTDAQKPKVKAAMEDFEKARRDAMSADRSERREKMQTATEDINKKMKEILTADQFTKWEELRKEEAKKRKQKKSEEKSGDSKSESKQ